MSKLPGPIHGWIDAYVSPEVEHLDSSMAAHVLVTLASKTLYEAFRAQHFFGISADSPVKSVMSPAKALRPERREDTRPWLRLAQGMIDKQHPATIPIAMKSLQWEMVPTFKSDIGPAFVKHWTEELKSQLKKIFEDVLNLFNALHRQDERYFIDMVPLKQCTFTGEHMQDLLADDEAALVGRDLVLSVYPVLYKHWKDPESREMSTVVLTKAKVVEKNVDAGSGGDANAAPSKVEKEKVMD